MGERLKNFSFQYDSHLPEVSEEEIKSFSHVTLASGNASKNTDFKNT
jgi:hypothetical protein